nr:hypothetical protein [Okeania sp. SIO2F4]
MDFNSLENLESWLEENHPS